MKRQKNDAADAAAIAEAARRPDMHYVAVKSAEHQARAVAYRTHQYFVTQRTQPINALRGHLAEFGLIFAHGTPHLKDIPLLFRTRRPTCLTAFETWLACTWNTSMC